MSVTTECYRNPVVRKLLNESQGIFHKLQNWVEANGQLGAEELTRISCEYRSSLRSTCISLQDEMKTIPDSQNLLDLYRSAELVWSLVELLFIRPSGGSVSVDLRDWACWNFTQVDQWTEEILAATSQGSCRPEDHPLFWQTIYLYISFGRCADAVKLLQTHTRKLEGAFRSVDELLRKMPLQTVGLDQNSAWNHWQEEVKRRLADQHYTAYPELEQIVKILSGEVSTWKEMSSLVPSWYEALVPLVIYKYSDVKLFELQDIVEEAFQLTDNNSESLRPLDDILLAVVELNILRALKGANSADWWLPAHLADLLFHAGCKDLKIDTPGIFSRESTSTADNEGGEESLFAASEEGKSVNLREYLLLKYARKLMSHSSLWQVGVDYLDACPARGAKALHSLLESVPLDSDHKAMKLMRIAEERGLSEVSRGICRRLGVKALEEKNLGVALGWCLQSKDSNFATYMAEKCLEEYGRTGLLHGLNLLDQIGDSAIMSPSLIFLGKYKEFHKLYQEERIKDAADLLCQLMKSRVAPRKFWITLLLDALPLLTVENEVIFDKEQTYQLIEIVETISTERDLLKSKAFATSHAEIEGLDMQIKRFRIALMKNLAQAVLQ